MKKIVLFVLLSQGVLSAYAQTSFGILAGLSNATQRSSRKESNPNRKYHLLWHAGVAADIRLIGRFYVQPQLLASAKGSGYEEHHDNNVYSFSDISSTKRLLYLELPVNLLYKQPLGPGKLIAGGGPYIAYGLGGKSKGTIKFRHLDEPTYVESTVKFKNNTRPTSADPHSYYRPLDAGLNFILGYELNNGLCLNVNYSLGLTDISPSTGTLPDGTPLYYETIKNSYFGLTVGYFLRKRT